MPTEDPQDNRAYCRAYYERLKSAPVKYARRLASIAESRRKRKASGGSPAQKPVKQPVKQPMKPCEAPVASGPQSVPVLTPVQKADVSDKGGKYAASQTQGGVGLTADDIVAAWQGLFDKQDLELEREAIREFGGG